MRELTNTSKLNSAALPFDTRETSVTFALDPKLETDTMPAIELELCTVRLMNDARYAWLILVPRQDGLVELSDLAHQERHCLTDEIDAVSRALSAIAGAYKMNVAALGNAVRQLHIHVEQAGAVLSDAEIATPLLDHRHPEIKRERIGHAGAHAAARGHAANDKRIDPVVA